MVCTVQSTLTQRHAGRTQSDAARRLHDGSEHVHARVRACVRAHACVHVLQGMRVRATNRGQMNNLHSAVNADAKA
jgi:hypothetical protein